MHTLQWRMSISHCRVASCQVFTHVSKRYISMQCCFTASRQDAMHAPEWYIYWRHTVLWLLVKLVSYWWYQSTWKGLARPQRLTFKKSAMFPRRPRLQNKVIKIKAEIFLVDQHFPTAFRIKRSIENPIIVFSKIQPVVYYQCCVLIGWDTTRLYVIAYK